MHMVNDKGEAVYYNLVRKNNKDYWLVQGIGPERYKLKEKGIDVEKWQEEVLRDDP